MPHRLIKHFHSYRFAITGIFKTLRIQSNIWIHLVAAVLVLMAAFWFRVTRTEVLVILLCIGMVISAELLNTAIEVSLNYLAKEHHVDVEAAKDIAAGGVLVASIIAAMIGLIVFLPYLLS